MVEAERGTFAGVFQRLRGESFVMAVQEAANTNSFEYKAGAHSVAQNHKPSVLSVAGGVVRADRSDTEPVAVTRRGCCLYKCLIPAT